jgi:hypothetical protein
MTDHDRLLAEVTFRIRTAVGSTLLVVALLAAMTAAWFSDNPGAGSAPASGVIDHWNFWTVVSGSKGAGNGFAIGGRESGLAGWLAVVLALTIVALVLTATECRWRLALAAAVTGAVSLVLEFLLRTSANGDHQGNSGPHSYDTAAGLALAQWVTVAIIVWALYVITAALRESR